MFVEGDGALIGSVKPLLTAKYGIRRFQEADPKIMGLNWRPTIWFESPDGVLHFVEASPDNFHPAIVQMNYAALVQAGRPIHVLVACTDASFRQTDANTRALRKREGFGLIVVDDNGHASLEFKGKPIVQVISEEEFKQHIHGAPLPLKRRLSDSFERYIDDSLGGVRDVSEVVEGICLRLHSDVNGQSPGNHNVSPLIDGMISDQRFRAIKAELNGARHYIATVRNPAHHHPKTKQAKAERIISVKTHFINGVRHCRELGQAAKRIGASGLLPA